MAEPSVITPPMPSPMTEGNYDTIIVGAGFSGVYQLIHLRKLGLRCIVIETGSDLGGTWYWNRYPGARVDVCIPKYELALPELWKDWTWSEKFPGWQEMQAYFAYVGERMDIRQHCWFNTVVKQAYWDDAAHLWHVTAEGKEGHYAASARYLILCTGCTSTPYVPSIKGKDTFRGPCCHTSRWPKDGIETSGKRVAIIGTGASGVQLIQEIGPQVAHLTVFQRTPNLALPMRQYHVDRQLQDHFKPTYEDLLKKLPETTFGIWNEFIPRALTDDSEEEREANLEMVWNLGDFGFWLSNYNDVLRDKASNDIAYGFWRKKVGERIHDPVKRALLAPLVAPHPFGTKRPCLEQRFYEVFNQDNVDLIDIKATPIVEINENGLRTADKEYEFDVLIFATGFDIYGGFHGIDLRGLDGKTIQDHWKDRVSTYLGLAIDKFPNLFIMYGPHGPGALCNGPVCQQMQGEWIADTIAYLRENHVTKFTATTQAAARFENHVEALCNATLFPQVDSWYMSANIAGRKRQAYSYTGGVSRYKQEIREEIQRGYPGFMRETLNE